MNTIKLKKIDESNFLDAFHMKLKHGQDTFVSHPIRSLAQAYVYYHQCTPFGIYYEDTMVGYVMIIYDYDLEEYNIWHMMIDAQHQGKGFGKQAMRKCLKYIATKPFGSSRKVTLTCNKTNLVAIYLYKSFGFIENGSEDEQELEFELELES